MNKIFFPIILAFFCSLSLVSAEKLGPYSIEEGKSLPFESGVSIAYGESGFIQVFILDDNFTAVFLDAERKVWVPEDVAEVIILAEPVWRPGVNYPFHLKRSSGGLYHVNKRHVYEPIQYHIQVMVDKERSRFPLSRARKYQYPLYRETYGTQLLSQ